MNPDKPRKHGPYYQLSYVRRGRSTSQFIRPAFVEEVKSQLANYKRCSKLTDEWVALALELARWRLEEAMLYLIVSGLAPKDLQSMTRYSLPVFVILPLPANLLANRDLPGPRMRRAHFVGLGLIFAFSFFRFSVTTARIFLAQGWVG